MNEFQKIHILSRELILVFDELEQETKEVLLEHIQDCQECQRVYSDTSKAEDHPTPTREEEVGIKPLKKLVQFNRGLKWLFITIRALLLFYIIFSAIQLYNWELSANAAIDYIKSGTFLFYFPAVLFLTVFAMMFFNKRWMVISLLFDLCIILFLDTLISLFI